jgi:AcrR family transcriptional regulator
MIIAAERVLAKHGVAGFTTNHVADIAGVSIGSLYQYFPNKQSILATLIERNASQFAATFERVLAAHPAEPPEVVAIALGLEFRAVYHAQGKVHLELYDQVPALGLLRILEASLARMTRQLAIWLGAHPRLAVRDPQATAWVFVRAVEGIARSFSIKHEDVNEDAVTLQTIAMLLSALPRRSEQTAR